MLILAIDLGTTGNRAVVVDQDLRVVSRAYEEFSQYFPRPGWVEHDPEEIWETARRTIREAISRVDAEKIGAVGVTNQRETVVCWDPESGRPLHRAIVWQDRRTSERCVQLERNGLGKAIQHRTGLRLDPYFSGTKIEWLLRNVPDTADGVFGTVDSWILWKLTGGRLHATDPSNASRTMLYNLGERRWDPELMQLFGVKREALPQVRPSSGDFGEIDPELFGFSAPVCGVAGDQQASMFAQGCYEPGIVKNTYGTGLFLLTNCGSEPRMARNLVCSVAWELDGQTEYALEGSVFVGGAALQWLRDGLHLIEDPADSESMADELNSNSDVYFVPALSGLGAPRWDPEARGMIIGLTRGTRREHVVRAALEANAYQTRDVIEAMDAELEPPVEKLQADGGACANDWLMQFQADLLGVPVERSAVLDTTAMGAAGLAGLHVGAWRGRDKFVACRKVDRIFEPQISPEERDRLHARWQEAVERARNWAK